MFYEQVQAASAAEQRVNFMDASFEELLDLLDYDPDNNTALRALRKHPRFIAYRHRRVVFYNTPIGLQEVLSPEALAAHAESSARLDEAIAAAGIILSTQEHLEPPNGRQCLVMWWNEATLPWAGAAVLANARWATARGWALRLYKGRRLLPPGADFDTRLTAKPQWNKVPAVLAALEAGCRTALWVDADIVLERDAAEPDPFTKALDDGSSGGGAHIVFPADGRCGVMFLAGVNCAEAPLNPGIFAVANTAWARDFLRTWINEVEDCSGGLLDDQHCLRRRVRDALGYDFRCWRRRSGGRLVVLRGHQSADLQCWEGVDGMIDCAEFPFAYHMASAGRELRVLALRAHASRFLTGVEAPSELGWGVLWLGAGRPELAADAFKRAGSERDELVARLRAGDLGAACALLATTSEVDTGGLAGLYNGAGAGSTFNPVETFCNFWPLTDTQFCGSLAVEDGEWLRAVQAVADWLRRVRSLVGELKWYERVAACFASTQGPDDRSDAAAAPLLPGSAPSPEFWRELACARSFFFDFEGMKEAQMRCGISCQGSTFMGLCDVMKGASSERIDEIKAIEFIDLKLSEDSGKAPVIIQRPIIPAFLRCPTKDREGRPTFFS